MEINSFMSIMSVHRFYRRSGMRTMDALRKAGNIWKQG